MQIDRRIVLRAEPGMNAYSLKGYCIRMLRARRMPRPATFVPLLRSEFRIIIGRLLPGNLVALWLTSYWSSSINVSNAGR